MTQSTGSSRFNSRVRGGRDTVDEMAELQGTFQLTRPRGTRRLNAWVSSSDCVSTHASAGDATSSRKDFSECVLFQLTRPRGTRLCAPDRPGRLCRFNSRVRGGRDITFTSMLEAHIRFNSRVRGGRDGLRLRRLSERLAVSTHASAGDATQLPHLRPRHTDVSTHASAGDATCGRLIRLDQPRVSTHASAGDATAEFQPRH